MLCDRRRKYEIRAKICFMIQLSPFWYMKNFWPSDSILTNVTTSKPKLSHHLGPKILVSNKPKVLVSTKSRSIPIGTSHVLILSSISWLDDNITFILVLYHTILSNLKTINLIKHCGKEIYRKLFIVRTNKSSVWHPLYIKLPFGRWLTLSLFKNIILCDINFPKPSLSKKLKKK